MITHDLQQGSQEWHAYRAKHFNASDAPAMMGVSPYKTRSELLKERATGLSKEIDATTQALFDNGHRFEALARSLAESIVGDDLYPVTGSMGELSASFDGLTMDERIAYEHKTLNNDIRGANSVEDLGEHFHVQMEQQLLISGAEKCLFLASQWDNEGELIEEKHFWYFPNEDLRARIVAGWMQFKKDVETYKHVEAIEPPQSAPIPDLPAVTIQVRGELTMCNLDAVTPKFDRFLSDAILVMKTDEEFATAEAQAKKGREVAKQCKLTAKAVVDQMSSIADVTRALEDYAAKFDALALKQEKAVAQQKESRKTAAKLERDKAYAEHINYLNDEIAPLRLVIADADKPNFVEAMKNQRTLASLYNKLDTELARVKIAADSVAAEFRIKHNWYQESSKDYEHLFADLQNLIIKPLDDFKLVITTRIANYKKQEADKAEALRAQIEREEQAKAIAAVEAQRIAELKRQQDEHDASQATLRKELEGKATAERIQQEQVEARTQAVLVAAQSQREAENVPGIQADMLAPSPLVTSIPVAQTQHDDGDQVLINLGTINAHLHGVSVTSEFLASVGFVAKQEKSAKLYRQSDLFAICTEISKHVLAVATKPLKTAA